MYRFAFITGWAVRLLAPVLVIAFAAVIVLAQGKTNAAPAVATQAAAAPSPLGPYAWILDLGVPGVLLVGFVMLWRHFQTKDKEHQQEKKDWAAEKLTLATAHEKERDKIWEEARKDKGTLRTSFESEKTEMRAIYTQEIKDLQAKYETETKDRREESQNLLREQTELTREVMSTAQAMSSSLQENTRAVDRFTAVVQRNSGQE